MAEPRSWRAWRTSPHPPAHSVEFAVTQGPNEVTAECDLIAIPASEPLLNQRVDTSVERGTDFAAETGAREIGAFTRDQAPVKPIRTFRGHLLIKIEIRADSKRDPLPAPGILKAPQLHDAADRAVAGRIDVGEFQMMHAPIDSVDDGERCAPELIIETSGNEPAHHGFAVAFAFQCPGRWRARDAVLGEGLVQPLDDIAAFSQGSQSLFCVSRQHPARRPGRLGQAQALERPHPADPDLLQDAMNPDRF